MPTNKKIQIVSNLSEKLAKAKSIVLTDYRGLTHKQLEEFRKALKKAGGEYMVIKNTLLRLALRDYLRAGSPAELPEEHLKNPTAILLSFQDEIAPLKDLLKIIKTLKLPVIKAGILGNRVLNAQEVEVLAKLPSKEVLLAQTVGTLKSPLYGLHFALSHNLRRLTYILSNINK